MTRYLFAFALSLICVAPAAAQTIVQQPLDLSIIPTKAEAEAAREAAAASLAAANAALAAANAADTRARSAQSAAAAAAPDLTPYAKTTDLAPLARAADVNATISTVQSSIMSAMPKRATTLPPTEVVAPTLGTSTAYRGADDPQPRITRAKQCTLDATASCTVTYEALAAANPNVIPVAQSTSPIFCTKTAAATTTSASIKCWLYQSAVLNLAIVTTGLTIGPALAPAGTLVDITVLPRN